MNSPRPASARPGYGYVYIVAMHHAGPIKIGSSKNPKKRIAELETSSGRHFLLCFVSEQATDYVEAEKSLHDKFKRDRMVGEWFDTSFWLAFEALNEMPMQSITKKQADELTEADLRRAADRIRPISAAEATAMGITTQWL